MAVAPPLDNIMQNQPDDATFRTWITWIRDSFLACGWLQSADSGQLTIASAVRPGSNNTYVAPLIFQMNDSLHTSATFPCYVRVECGTGGGAGNPAVRITVGTSTNGAGVIGGNSTGAMQFTTASTSTNLDKFMRASGSSSRMAMGLWVPSAALTSVQNCGFIGIERTHAADGSDTADGIMVFTKMSATTVAHNHIVLQPPGQANGVALSTAPISVMEANTSTIRGITAGAYPCTPSSVRPVLPLMNLLAYYNNDFTGMVPVVVNHFGANHTYLPLGVGAIQGMARSSTANDANVAMMRYE